MLPPTNAFSDGVEGEIARLCEEISDRLCRHEQVDIEDYTARWPEHADELRQLLPAMQMMAQLQADASPTPAGSTFSGVSPNQALGDFRIVREIARGGMGVVYEAEQLSLRRNVALKVLPYAAVLDTRQLRRFHNEARAAALLHHPQIVPVYGVGCERGVHYYAMQLIEGPTLAQVIRDLRSRAGLDPQLPERNITTRPATGESVDLAQAPAMDVNASCDSDAAQLADPYSPSKSTVPQGVLSTARSHRSPLFVQAAVQLGIEVAEALDYAHDEGVLHRDIKPGNLLLDARGKVWVADFGLARIEADPSMTLTGDLVGTLRYMSPEQALAKRATIDGRSDVYSLGATLYELLTLQPVFDGEDKQTLLRQIAFEEPRPPRQHERGLPFELETILLKTLAKDPGERYATAGALAEDLRRFLEQKPIQARRPSLTDRATKWALRNRRLVVTAAAGLLLTVVTLAVASLLIWNEQHKTQDALDATVAESKRADEQAAIAQAVNDFLQQDLLGLIDHRSQVLVEMDPDPDVKLRTLLDRASAGMVKRFCDQPQVLHAVRMTVAQAFSGIGRYTDAIQLLEQVREYRARTLGPEHTDTLQGMHELSRAYHGAGQLDKAISLAEEALRGSTSSLGPEDPRTQIALVGLAALYRDQARYAEAERLLVRGLETSRRIPGMGSESVHQLENQLGLLYMAQGRYQEAEAMLTHGLETRRRVKGPEHPDTLTAMNNLGLFYNVQRRYWDSEPLLTKVLETSRRVLGPDHPDLLLAMNNLAATYREKGDYSKAISLFEEVLPLSVKTLGPEHPHTYGITNNLAIAYREIGESDRAVTLYEHLIPRMKTARGPEHPDTLASMLNLAATYVKVGQLDRALPLIQKTLESRQRQLGDQHPDTLASLSTLGEIFWRMQKWEKSIPIFEEEIRVREATMAPDHPYTLVAKANLGVNYRDAGRLEEGLALLEEAYGKAHDQPALRWVGNELLETYILAGMTKQAVDLAHDRLNMVRATLPSASSQLAGALAAAAMNLLRVRASDEAEAILRESLAIREQHEPDAWTTYNTRSMLGGALLGQQKYVEAEPLLLQGYEGMKHREDQIPTEGKVRLIEALERLVQLCESLEKLDEAARWRSELEATKQRMAPQAN